MKPKTITIPEEEIPEDSLKTIREVDLSSQLKAKANGTKKEVISICIDHTYPHHGKMVTETFWKALKAGGEVYWTNSDTSPQILNVATGKGRGNIAFMNGDVGKLGGRPKGSSNRITAKDVCDNLGVHPSELYAAIMLSDPSLCRKYGIRDTKTISIKNKMDASKELYSRLEGAAKANQLDSRGDVVDESQDKDRDVTEQLQVYIPRSHYHDANKDLVTVEFNEVKDE